MKCFSAVFTLFLTVCIPFPADGEVLSSGEYFVSQSWSQERDYKRRYYISVPNHARRDRLPVFIFLHGNGGNGRQAMHGFMRNHRTIATRYIMVFPDGYQKCWNVVAERSQADDRGFIEEIVLRLSDFQNVQSDNFTVMGASNGAALVNQLAIECRMPNIRNYISGVSPLNTLQHDGKNFRAKGDNNDYSGVAEPLNGRRLLNISGTDDRLVPYRGGRSSTIPGKGDRLAFVDAEESTFLWARQMGYNGGKLSRPTRVKGNLEFFSYLDGDVVHIKVIGEGHGAPGAVKESTLLEFLEDSDQNISR